MLSQEQKNIIQQILAPFAPERIGIFGSVAREEAKPDSDLDILVNFTKRLTLLDLIDLEQQLSESLHCKVDLVTEGALHPALKQYVERDIIYLNS
jgi:predicted nucleotidyltransferase